MTGGPDSKPSWTPRAIVIVAVLGGLGAWLLPSTQAGRFGAVLGVGLVTASSVVSVVIKRWELSRSFKAALVGAGVVFFLRIVLAVGGIVLVHALPGALLAFVVGFFISYLVLQWIEISDVLSEEKRRRGEM